jgi:NAD(P)-dependent dehydrogenase (short-subunit alcohol dehydrogenase family)
MQLGLKDKVALITGASRGIGAASAKRPSRIMAQQ